VAISSSTAPAAANLGHGRRPAARSQQRAKERFAWLLVAPTFVIVALFTLFPIGYLFWVSLHAVNGQQMRFLGLDNYGLVATDPSFWDAARVTVLYVVATTGSQLLLGFALALVLSRKLPGLGIVRTLLIIPMAMTPVVVGLTWRLLYTPPFGLVNYSASLVGIGLPPMLTDPILAFVAVVVVDIWQWTPFMMLLVLAGLQSLPNEPFEAAAVDGASRVQALRYLTIPMLRGIVLVALIFRGIDAFDTFDTIYVLTRGGPGTATQTLTMFDFFQAFRWFHFGYAAAVAMVMLALLWFVSFGAIRSIGRQLLAGHRA
jgi:multiple sugar transport system permease protein